MGVSEREEMREDTEKNIWPNNSQKFPKFDENYKSQNQIEIKSPLKISIASKNVSFENESKIKNFFM